MLAASSSAGTDTVTVVAAFATAAAAIAAAVSAFYAAVAARATKRAANGEVFMALEARLQEPVMRSHRATLLKSTDEDWSSDDEETSRRLRDAADAVAQAFQTAGHLCRHGIIDETLIVENWGASASRCWVKSRRFVESRRKSENVPSLFDDFEWLAAQGHAMHFARP